MNTSILLGRLTKNPEIRYSQTNQVRVANFTLAVNRKYVKEGEERQADFINIVAFSKLADFVEKHLKQGLQICVKGRIQTRSWEDQEGQKRYATEVIAEEIDFADSPKKAGESKLWSKPAEVQDEAPMEELVGDDDLPFWTNHKIIL